jgi:hypothetical protein
MKTKQEIITELKLEFPTLRVGNDDDGYTDLSAEEYEATIAQWADGKLERIARETEAATKATQRQALLAQLGITEEQAKLLLS